MRFVDPDEAIAISRPFKPVRLSRIEWAQQRYANDPKGMKRFLYEEARREKKRKERRRIARRKKQARMRYEARKAEIEPRGIRPAAVEFPAPAGRPNFARALALASHHPPAARPFCSRAAPEAVRDCVSRESCGRLWPLATPNPIGNTMATRTYVKTLDGTQVPESTALDERGLLRDGFTLRVAAMMMDGSPFPSIVTSADPRRLSDAQVQAREDRIAKHRKELSDAWRNPDAPFAVTKPAAVDPTRVTDAYARHDRWLADAWR